MADDGTQETPPLSAFDDATSTTTVTTIAATETAAPLPANDTQRDHALGMASRLIAWVGGDDDDQQAAAVAQHVQQSPQFYTRLVNLITQRLAAPTQRPSASSGEEPAAVAHSDLKAQLQEAIAEKLTLQIKLEQASHDFELREAELRQEQELASTKYDRYKQQLDEAETSNDRLRQEFRTLKQQLDSHATSVSSWQTTAKKLEAEKQQIFDKLLQRESALDRLTEELAEWHTKMDGAKEQLAKAESSAFEMQTRERELNFKCTKLEQELALSNQHRDWLDREVKSRSDEFAALRQEKSALQLRLQTELDNCKANVTSSETTIRQLRETVADLTGNYEQCQLRLGQLQQHSAVQVESLRQELETQKKLTDALRRADSQKNEKLVSLNEQLAAIEKVVKDRTNEFNDTVAANEEENSQLQTRITELTDEIAALNRRLKCADDLLGQYGIDPTADHCGSTNFSPTAAVLSKLQKSGKTFTQVYADFCQAQNEIAKLKAENTHVKRGMDDILREVEQRASEYQQIEAAYETMSRETADMSADLDKAVAEQKRATARLADIQVECRQLEDDNRWLRQTNRDLSDQLTSLLVTVEELEGRVMPAMDNSAEINDSTGSDVQAIITERLVVVKNVHELQQKNQELLEIVRKLSDQKESNELAERETELDQLRQKYAEAMGQLQQLIQQRRQNETVMQSVVNERDMYRKMASQNNNLSSSPAPAAIDRSFLSPSPNGMAAEADLSLLSQHSNLQQLHEAQASLEALRRETAQDSKLLQEQLNSVQMDLSEHRVKLAQASTQSEFLQQRTETLNKTVDQQTAELQALRQRNASLMSNLGKFEERLDASESEKVRLRSEIDKATQELAHLRAEKELTLSTEARHAEDREMLSKERNRLNDLIRHLQTMHSELERAELATKRQLEEEKASMAQEISRLRQQVADSSSELKAMTARKDSAMRELQQRYDSKVLEFTQTRENLIAIESRASATEARLVELRAEVKAREDELRVMRARPTVSTSSHAATSAASTTLPVNVELESQLTRAKQDLAEMKLEADRQRAHAETYMEISKSAEEKLAQNNETFAEYQADTRRQLDELEAANTELVTQVQQLTAQVEQLTSALSSAEQQANEHNAALQKELDDIRAVHQAALDSAATAEANQSTLLNDVERQRQIAEEAARNYEDELIKHAKSMEQVASLKERVKQLQESQQHLQSTATNSAQQLETATQSWTTQKAQLDTQLQRAESRLADITAQNTLLHEQLETMGANLSKLQQRPALLDADDDHNVDDNVVRVAMAADMRTIEQLREVIKFLRRDKEVLDYEKEAQRQECSRLQAQYEFATRSLDEARAQLTDMQHRQQTGRLVGAQEHEELMAKAAQVDLLRNTNQTTRDENTRLLDRTTFLERRVQELSATLSPLQEQLRRCQAELQARQQEIKLLEEDNSRWKNRTQQILAKYDKIDPVEHRQLAESLEKLQRESREQIDTLQRTVEEKNTSAVQQELKVQQLQAEVERLSASDIALQKLQPEVDQAKAELGNVLAERDSLKTQIATIEEKLQTATETVTKVNKVNISWKKRAIKAEETLAANAADKSTADDNLREQLKNEFAQKAEEEQRQRQQQHQAELEQLKSIHEQALVTRNTIDSKQKLRENMQQKKLQRAEEEVAVLQARIVELEKEIAALEQARATAKASIPAKIVAAEINESMPAASPDVRPVAAPAPLPTLTASPRTATPMAASPTPNYEHIATESTSVEPAVDAVPQVDMSKLAPVDDVWEAFEQDESVATRAAKRGLDHPWELFDRDLQSPTAATMPLTATAAPSAAKRVRIQDEPQPEQVADQHVDAQAQQSAETEMADVADGEEDNVYVPDEEDEEGELSEYFEQPSGAEEGEEVDASAGMEEPIAADESQAVIVEEVQDNSQLPEVSASEAVIEEPAEQPPTTVEQLEVETPADEQLIPAAGESSAEEDAELEEGEEVEEVDVTPAPVITPSSSAPSRSSSAAVETIPTAPPADKKVAAPSLRSKVPPAPPAPIVGRTAGQSPATQPLIVTKTGFAIPKIVFEPTPSSAAEPTLPAAAAPSTVAPTPVPSATSTTPSTSTATPGAAATATAKARIATRSKIARNVGGVARNALEGLVAARGRGRPRGKSRNPPSTQ